MPLILLPNRLGRTPEADLYIPPAVGEAVKRLDGLIAESPMEGRAFLGRYETKLPLQQIPIAILNGKTPEADFDFLLEPVAKGETWGVVPDAGVPCLADPGSALVKRARKKGLEVEAVSGPSSLLIALMLSGFPSQRFSFNGYVRRERIPHLQEMEKRSLMDRSTQVFIEAPYRNRETLAAVLDALNPKTELCVAVDLTLPTQQVIAQPIAWWKNAKVPDLHKRPAVFLISA